MRPIWVQMSFGQNQNETAWVRIAEFEQKLTGLMTHGMCTNMYSKLVGIGEVQFFNPENTD